MKQRFSKRTRLVSALLTLAMVFTFLPFSAFAEGEGRVPIGEDNYGPFYFPDSTFRTYLHKFDKNGDDYLSKTELDAIKEISVGEKGITNLQGINFFPNLEKLNCNNNQLTTLNVKSNLNLKQLDCSENQLTELNVWENDQLTKLDCDYNQLTSLDLQYNTELQLLSCHKNNLTSLNVSKNTALKNLYCSENQLSSLDVSKNTALEVLICYNNQLSSLGSLGVSQNAALWRLNCSGNRLTSLDVSQNAALKELYCYKNQLTELNVSGNPVLWYLDCGQNSLTSLDVSQTAVTTLDASDNQIDINVETTPRTFDLSTLPGFDMNKVSGWNGGTVKDNILTVNKNATRVTYDYNCGNGLSRDFTLNVNVVPDGSGGGTTIHPEAGKYQLTVTDGFATVKGIKGAMLNVTPGDTVTLTADTTKFPENEEFGWWEITPYGSVSDTLTGQYQRTAKFTMPNENVSARAMSKSAGVSTGGDDGGGGGGAAILLVGGAAVAGLVGYGVYSYVSEQQLKALLPEGVAMPENRAQTALLLWNTAGRPEPAEAPAFKDVADPDTAKAAQWCVEHGLMDQKLGGRFAPDNSDPAYKTLNAYQQLVG